MKKRKGKKRNCSLYKSEWNIWNKPPQNVVWPYVVCRAMLQKVPYIQKRLFLAFIWWRVLRCIDSWNKLVRGKNSIERSPGLEVAFEWKAICHKEVLVIFGWVIIMVLIIKRSMKAFWSQNPNRFVLEQFLLETG